MKIRIASLLLNFEGIASDLIPENTKQFVVNESKEADITYYFHLVEDLPLPSSHWEIVYKKEAITIYKKDKLEQRLLFEPVSHTLYGIYKEINEFCIEVWYAKSLQKELSIDTIFHSCLALERHFARRGCYILHCAFLTYSGNAILFSGPSGIGKSTHADLWCKYIVGSSIVNGDRCLISRNEDGTYEANGWPVCGSSNICHQAHYPVKAIVFMGQSINNKIVDLSLMQRFRFLNMQVTINHWNSEATYSAMDWLLELASKVYITSYACNMNANAPVILAEHLKRV